MIKRILLGVSGTPSLDAKIGYARDLALQHEAVVELVSIVDVDRLSELGPIPIGAGHFADRLVSKRIAKSHEIDDRALAKCKESLEADGIKAVVLRHEGDPLALLADLWRYTDLCILGARGWFDYDVIDDPEGVLGRVIASGVRPILAVPDQHRPVRKVVIAYNGVLEAAKAMKHFVQFRPFEDVSIEIVCAGASKTSEPPEQLLADALTYVRSHGFPCTTTRIEDLDSAEGLLRHVRAHDIDMVVMGGSYTRILLARRFGRTTMAMLRKSEVPLFISH